MQVTSKIPKTNQTSEHQKPRMNYLQDLYGNSGYKTDLQRKNAILLYER